MPTMTQLSSSSSAGRPVAASTWHVAWSGGVSSSDGLIEISGALAGLLGIQEHSTVSGMCSCTLHTLSLHRGAAVHLPWYLRRACFPSSELLLHQWRHRLCCCSLQCCCCITKLSWSAVRALTGVPEATRVSVEPFSSDDWEMVEQNAGHMEEQLCNQVPAVDSRDNKLFSRFAFRSAVQSFTIWACRSRRDLLACMRRASWDADPVSSLQSPPAGWSGQQGVPLHLFCAGAHRAAPQSGSC